MTFFYPQVVNGGSNPTYRTTILQINNGTTTVTGTIRFRKPDGSPLVVTLKGGQSDSEFSFTLGPRQTQLLETSGAGALAVGYATVESSGPLGGTLIFSAFDSSGRLVTEAAVPASQNLTNFTLFFDTREGFNAGLAVANTGGANSTLTLRLFGTDGSPLSTTPASLTLAANEHKAQFVDQFAEFVDIVGNKVGSVEVNATSPVSAVTLRTASSGNLTTTPIVPRSAASQASESATDAILERVTIVEAPDSGVTVTIRVGDTPEPIRSFILRFTRHGDLVHEEIAPAATAQSDFHFAFTSILFSKFDHVQIRPVFVSGLLGRSSTFRK